MNAVGSSLSRCRQYTQSLLSALLLTAMSMPAAQALEIKAEVFGNLNGTAFTPAVDGPLASGVVDVLGSTTVAASDIFYHTYGNDAGNFGSRVSGHGIFDITGVFTYTDTITNTSGLAQAYNFGFTVIPGEITVSGVPLAATDFLFAEYSIDILVNGSSIWDSAASISKDSSSAAATFSDSGTFSLGGSFVDAASISRYSWDQYVDSVALGTLANGQSLDFEYRLTSHARGNADCAVSGGVAGFDGLPLLIGDGDAIAGGPGRLSGSCGAIARSGDPFFFGGSAPNTSSISATPASTSVPEPSVLALLGLGLAGLIGIKKSPA